MPKISYVYIVQFRDMLKVGYSRSLTPQQQTWRYATVYAEFDLNIWTHSKPRDLKRQLKVGLKPYSAKVNSKRTGELFWSSWSKEYNYDITTNVFEKATRICIENDAKYTQKIGYDCGKVMTLDLDEKSNIYGSKSNRKQNASITKALI